MTETVNESAFDEIGFLEGLGMKGRVPEEARDAKPNRKLLGQLRNLTGEI